MTEFVLGRLKLEGKHPATGHGWTTLEGHAVPPIVLQVGLWMNRTGQA